MYTASDILKMLKMLDDELKSEIKDAEPKTHDSPYNTGFAVGLYSARMGIRQIFKAVIRKAADTIKELDDFTDSQCARLLEKLQKAEEAIPRWISVEERLPDCFEPVIVCRKGGKVEQGHRDVNDWWKVYGTRTKHVTHWMPLPKPPEDYDYA